MADTSDFHVALKPALAEAVRQAVENGEYASDEEVIREALIEWRLRRELNEADRETISRFWDAGIASGSGRCGSMEELKQEARRRWAEEHSVQKG